jgi:hypothetical protein
MGFMEMIYEAAQRTFAEDDEDEDDPKFAEAC